MGEECTKKCTLANLRFGYKENQFYKLNNFKHCYVNDTIVSVGNLYNSECCDVQRFVRNVKLNSDHCKQTRSWHSLISVIIQTQDKFSYSHNIFHSSVRNCDIMHHKGLLWVCGGGDVHAMGTYFLISSCFFPSTLQFSRS